MNTEQQTEQQRIECAIDTALLNADLLREQVAELEAELSELRQRVCVPVEALEHEFPLLPDDGLDEVAHHCEWAIQQDRKRLHALIATHQQPAPTACTGKNCGSTDPNLHSADCFAEHEQAIAPTSARKAPPEDPLCGIEYRADGEANFYTLSAATGSWIARIQFNGQFYPHEQERILSAMLGDRNVRYGDGYYDGYWSARKESAAAQDVAGLPFVRKILEKLERFRECAEDDEGVDIGRHWLDVLTRLGLLNRVQRSPARWEMTAQADDALETAHQQREEQPHDSE